MTTPGIREETQISLWTGIEVKINSLRNLTCDRKKTVLSRYGVTKFIFCKLELLFLNLSETAGKKSAPYKKIVCMPFWYVASLLLRRMIYCRNTSPTWSNYRVFYDPPRYKCWSSFWSAHTGATMRGATWAGHVRGCISTCQNSTIIMCNYAAVEKSRPWFGSSEWEVCLLLSPWHETRCQTFQPSISPHLFFSFFKFCVGRLDLNKCFCRGANEMLEWINWVDAGKPLPLEGEKAHPGINGKNFQYKVSSRCQSEQVFQVLFDGTPCFLEPVCLVTDDQIRVGNEHICGSYDVWKVFLKNVSFCEVNEFYLY